MKKFLVFFALFFIGFQAQSQQQEKRCEQQLSLSDSLVKMKQFEKAAVSWKEVREKCPKLSEKIYIVGADILKYQIQQAKPEDKEKAVRELLKLYDEHAQAFPSSSQPFLVNKAMVLHENKFGTPTEIYQYLDAAFATHPEKFNDPNALFLYFQLYFEKYKSGDKTITPKHVFAKRDALSLQLEKLKSYGQKNQRPLERVQKSINRLTDQIANCENLSEYYQSAYEANKKNATWLSNAAAVLLDKKCHANPLTAQFAKEAFDLAPSSQSAYTLGMLEYGNGKLVKAAEYLEQSAQLSENPDEKAERYYLIASSLYMGSDPAKMKQSLQKAITAKPSFGKAYLLLAQRYGGAANDCGTTAFEKKALNWLAVQTLDKAILADKTIKASAEKLRADYLSKAPNSKEIKEAKLAGKTINFACWINESILVPKS